MSHIFENVISKLNLLSTNAPSVYGPFHMFLTFTDRPPKSSLERLREQKPKGKFERVHYSAESTMAVFDTWLLTRNGTVKNFFANSRSLFFC